MEKEAMEAKDEDAQKNDDHLDVAPEEVQKPYDGARKPTEDDIQLAFQYILGVSARKLDVDYHLRHQSVDEMRHVFFSSEGFIRSIDPRAILKTNWIAVDSKQGFLIWVSLDDLYVSMGAIQGHWEPAETAFCRRTLNPGSVFMDIGAMIGWFTLLAAHLVGSSGHVYSFEPHEETANYLRSSIGLNRFEDRVSLFPIALSDHESAIHLYREIGLANGRLNAGNTWMKEAEQTEANELLVGTSSAVRLDTMRFDRKIDLLKIDVEGAEWKVFLGAEATIKQHRPTIMCEIFPDQLQKVSQVGGHELIEKLASWGYSPYFILPDGNLRKWQTADMPHGQYSLTNIVFK